MNTDIENSKGIGTISNYYGGLNIVEKEGKYYWSLDNYDGNRWEQIPQYLFDSLDHYEKKRQEKQNLEQPYAVLILIFIIRQTI